MKNKKILIPLIVLMIASAGYGLWYFKFRTKIATSVTDMIATKQQKQQDNSYAAQKKQSSEDTPQSTPLTTPQSENIKLIVSQETNNTVTIVTKLKGVSDGICKLDITNGTAKTSMSAKVIYQTEYSTCAGFSVPISSIGKGTWNIHLTLNTNGTSVMQTNTYEVQ